MHRRGAGADEQRRAIEREGRSEAVTDRGLGSAERRCFDPVRARLPVHVDHARPELIVRFPGEYFAITDEDRAPELRERGAPP